MTDPRPLWEVMEESTGTVAEWGDMIRAVADWIVAELETTTDCEGWEPAPLIELRDLRALLTAEADRAERGEKQ